MSRPSPSTVGSAMVWQPRARSAFSLATASSIRCVLVPVRRVVAADLLVEHEHVLVHQRGAQARRRRPGLGQSRPVPCQHRSVESVPTGRYACRTRGGRREQLEAADGFRIRRAHRGTPRPAAGVHRRAHLPGRDDLLEEQVAKPPREGRGWERPPVMDELKAKARAPRPVEPVPGSPPEGAGLTNLQYAPLAELSGTLVPGPRGPELRGPRHRQHGGAGRVRHASSSRTAGCGRCWTARSGRRSA